MSLVYETEITVTEEHIDGNNHVNNVQYVHWVAMVAAAHWDLLKSGTEYEEDIWMLFDHHIRYKKQVYLDDILTVKTYPEAPEGIRQPRKVEFNCKGELVVESRTLWVLMEKQTQKIRRLGNNWLTGLSS